MPFKLVCKNANTSNYLTIIRMVHLNINRGQPFSNQKITYCGLDQKILRQTMAQDVSRSFGTVGGELRDETRKDVEN
ncbi:hypothetical protein L5515_018384 [Caenorhabditis briggsae]|uniref:Uncharacterized protein n=1 Tax=Caenorhabditis briggsae TaxID=6238 RepID=A0AAE9JRI8_CAEBR|nr:hypothetical protein L5515_018384 [Caenorhabditis briggsae]